MTAFQDNLLVFLVLINLAMLGVGRLGACIRLVAMQGVAAGLLAGLLPLAGSGGSTGVHAAAIGGATILLKGLVFPRLLFRALRESNTSREIRPYVGQLASLLLGVVALMAAFWLDHRLALPVLAPSALMAPVAFYTMFAGLFLIVTRRTAVSQVIGFLTLENGIYLFGLTVVRDIPFLIELGVLMDVFVAVFVMGIAIDHINREFDHIDADRLNTLKG